ALTRWANFCRAYGAGRLTNTEQRAEAFIPTNRPLRFARGAMLVFRNVPINISTSTNCTLGTHTS
ncbi:MAG: hypothetical protein WCB00_14660, partial [Candidatus Acidiferrales bacterium]